MTRSFWYVGTFVAVAAWFSGMGIAGAAEPISFSARVNEELRVADTEVVQHEGKSYVSLNSLVTQLGGGCLVSPERIQVDITAKSAWLRASQTGVNASLGSFSLTSPVVARGSEALISLEDVGPFFEQAFRVGIRQDSAVRPQPQPAAVQEEVPELEPVTPGGQAPAETPPVAAAPEGTVVAAVEQTPLGAPGQPAAVQPAAAVPNEAAPALESVESPATGAPAMTPAAPEEAAIPTRSIGRAVEVIIIDPGHGGSDPGCESANGLRESAVTLQLAERLRQAIEKGSHLKALVTRDKDRGVSRNERVNFANGNRGDLFVSLHVAASFSPAASGAAVYCCAAPAAEAAPAADTEAGADAKARPLPAAGYDYAPRSLEAAKVVAAALSAPVRALPFQILKDIAMPGVVVEAGYATNVEDEKQLQAEAWQQQTAETLAAAIKQFAGVAAQGVAP